MIIEKFNYSLDKIHEIIPKILKNVQKNSIIIFTGNPGVGKSTIIYGIINHLEGDNFLLQSPTFTKIHQYNHIIHMDLYEAKSLENYYHYFDDDKLMLIEWGNLFEIPWDFSIDLSHIDHNTRQLILTKNTKI